MIQFSQARCIYLPDQVRSWDFQPHVCILQAGTNDIGSKSKHMKDSDWEEHIAGHLYALAEHLATNYNVRPDLAFFH